MAHSVWSTLEDILGAGHEKEKIDATDIFSLTTTTDLDAVRRGLVLNRAG